MPRRKCGNTRLLTGWRVVVLLCGMGMGVPVGGRAWGGARPAEGPEALGMMAVTGVVRVDRLPVPPSTTVFRGDTVATDKGSTAIVRFRSGMTLALEENGEMALPVGGGGGNDLILEQGLVTLTNPGPGAARVKVLGASVEVRGQAGRPGVCRIVARGERAEVFAARGEMEIRGRGRPVSLAEGQVARFEAGPAGGAPQAARQAGTVSGEIPAETIQRQGQGKAQPLNLHDAVNWQDVVETENTGRVRIALQDGSVLNVGARSVMRIVQHDPQTQQTEVELTLGRVRSQVVKLTKPGAKFELKTQTAVIGVVGTIFVVEADQNSTRVMCIEGQVAVQNVNPAVQGQVQLGPGQSTVVESGLAPTAASATSATELQTAVERTEIRPGAGTVPSGPQAPTGGPASAGTTTGGVVRGTSGAGTTVGGAASGVSGAGTTLTVGTAAAAAAGGVSAVAGVTALSQANDATNGLNQANSALQDSTAAANAATTAINQQNTLSPSTPCGCGP
jgi:FecR protein